ncbi:MAG: hypothetical protein HQ513_02320 [Rhodospirillales bacterium]|nr:hypothetical protein [Rhodospirillales bacterium]
MSHQGRYRRLLVVACIFSVVFALMPPSSAVACGWWGDGEASDSDDAIDVDAQGRPIVEEYQQGRGPLLPAAMKVPQAMGYGIAVSGIDTAVPYLEATGGLAANNIGQLAGLGYASVIDLGTPPSVATLHRAETEVLGMRYFNIPGDDESWAGKDIATFAEIVNDKTNLPLLVFARSKQALGRIWASFRLAQGADEATANREGRLLGLPE